MPGAITYLASLAWPALRRMLDRGDRSYEN